MRSRLRRVLVAIMLVAAVACGALALRPSPAPAGGAAPALATPVWSARRLPAPIVDPLTAERERRAAGALQQAVEGEVGRYGTGCAMVVRGSTVLSAANVDAPLIPASTQKLLTAAAALTTLGPDFRFETRAVAMHDGAAQDRLWLVGSGDPVIRTAEYMDEGVSTPLEALADAIVARGIRKVGTVVGDDSRYDQERFVPSWSPAYRTNFDVGPLGALTVTQGVILVGGRPVMADDPAQFAAAELTRLLRDRGVEVGEPSRGVAPPEGVDVGSVTSQPMRVLVSWMLATSDNIAAELLTKEMGLRSRGAGTTASGVAAIRDALEALGVSLAGAVLVDGSGLDRGNRLTCRILLEVVDLGGRGGFEVLRETLPGGRRAAAEGLVRAKGGYLTDVTGLAGLVARTPVLRFAFLANGGVPKAANAELARFAAVLAGYQAPTPVPDSVVPEPRSVR